jgi:endo-1,4-beta-xylanase
MKKLLLILMLCSAAFNAFGRDALQVAAQSKDVFIGCLISRQSSASKDMKFINFIDTTFDKVVIGMNMNLSWPSRNTFNWNWPDSSLDAVMAMTNKKKIHVNTLIWGSQIPTWITGGGYSVDSLRNFIHIFIDSSMIHLRNKVGPTYTIEYDVVNEYMNETNWWRTNLPNYFYESYRYARAADPAAILCYNDWGIESKYDRYNKGDRFYRFVKSQHDTGVQIDVIGLQSHMGTDTGAVTSKAGVIRQIKRLQALGYRVDITELDWKMSTPITDTAATFDLQARSVGAYIDQAVKSGIKNVTMWGFDDSTSWLNGATGYGNATMCKKWNGSYFPKKPMYYAILSALTTSNNVTKEKNIINIRVNQRTVASVVDSFPLVYDLRNAGISFWSSCKDDGSDIYITDSSGNVKNSYLSGFSKTKKLGLLHFVSKVDTVGNRLLKIRFGDKTHTTTNSVLAFTNAGVVNCFDLSRTDTIRDMAGNTNLIVSNGAQMSVIDTAPLGYGIKTYNSQAYNVSATYPLSNLTSGSIETMFYSDSVNATYSRYLFNISQSDGNNRVGVLQNSTSNKSTLYTYVTQAGTSTFLSTYDSSTFDSSWHTSFLTWNNVGAYPYLDDRSEKGRLANRSIAFTGNAYYTMFTTYNRTTNNNFKGILAYVAVHSSPRDANYNSTRQNLLNDNSNFWITTEAFRVTNDNGGIGRGIWRGIWNRIIR